MKLRINFEALELGFLIVSPERRDLREEYLRALEKSPELWRCINAWAYGTSQLSGPENSEKSQKALGDYFASSAFLLGVLYAANGHRFPNPSKNLIEESLNLFERKKIEGLISEINERTDGNMRDEWLECFEKGIKESAPAMQNFGKAMLLVAARAFLCAAEKEFQTDVEKVLEKAKEAVSKKDASK